MFSKQCIDLTFHKIIKHEKKLLSNCQHESIKERLDKTFQRTYFFDFDKFTKSQIYYN